MRALPRKLIPWVLASAALVGCAPAATTPGRPIEVAENPGRRLDMVIQVDTLEGARALLPSDVTGTVTALWSDSDRFRSWFTVVERVREPRDTVVMAISVHVANHTTQVTGKNNWTLMILVGIPPNLRAHRVETTASVKLVDAATGIVLASSEFTHNATHLSIGDADTERAGLRAALREAAQQALRSYAGG